MVTAFAIGKKYNKSNEYLNKSKNVAAPIFNPKSRQFLQENKRLYKCLFCRKVFRTSIHRWFIDATERIFHEKN